MKALPINPVGIRMMRNGVSNYIEITKENLDACHVGYIPTGINPSPMIKNNDAAISDITDGIMDELDELYNHELFTSAKVTQLVVGDMVTQIHNIGLELVNLYRLYEVQYKFMNQNMIDDVSVGFELMESSGKTVVNMLGSYLDESILIQLGFTKKELRRR